MGTWVAHYHYIVGPGLNAARLRAAERNARKDRRMKQFSLFARALSILAVGIMFTGTAQAQDVKVTTAVVTEETVEVCTFIISGKGENMAGMVCSSCTRRVETALLDVEGVISVDAVDYTTGTATVTIVKKSKAKELIPAAIVEVNFKATLVVADDEAEPATDE